MEDKSLSSTPPYYIVSMVKEILNVYLDSPLLIPTSVTPKEWRWVEGQLEVKGTFRVLGGLLAEREKKGTFTITFDSDLNLKNVKIEESEEVKG
jgi:hypothetical protein